MIQEFLDSKAEEWAAVFEEAFTPTKPGDIQARTCERVQELPKSGDYLEFCQFIDGLNGGEISPILWDYLDGAIKAGLFDMGKGLRNAGPQYLYVLRKYNGPHPCVQLATSIPVDVKVALTPDYIDALLSISSFVYASSVRPRAQV